MTSILLALVLAQSPAPPLAAVLVPSFKPRDEAGMAGLPAAARPLLLTWKHAYSLALARSRSGDTALALRVDEKGVEALAEKHGVNDFARFREDWLKQGDGSTFRDPAAEILDLLAIRAKVETTTRDLDLWDHWVRVMSELIAGEASGLRLVDLDRAETSRQDARIALPTARALYRDAMDALKSSLGLEPRSAALPDLSVLKGFETVFREADDWHFKPTRKFEALPVLAMRLPSLGELKLNDRVLNDLMTGGDDLAWEAAVAEIAATAGDTRAELALRKGLRGLGLIARSYEVERRRFVLNMRLVSNSIEVILTLPANATGFGGLSRGAILSLHAAKRREWDSRERLVALWLAFQKERLSVWRALGILPATDWKAYFDSLTSVPTPAPALAAPAPVAR